MIRLFDIILSVLGIILLFPIILTTCLILKFTGERKVFYLQKRVGVEEKEFFIFKFATMYENSDSKLNQTITVSNDPRILPVGNFLRKTKLNEIPQLINVILGDMSLIGPRPLVKKNLDFYKSQDRKIILTNKPGLSGIGSIIFSNEENLLNEKEDAWNYYIKQIIPYKSTLEVWFSKNINLRLYFELIFFTIYVILTNNSKLLFDYYKTLPEMPKELQKKI